MAHRTNGSNGVDTATRFDNVDPEKGAQEPLLGRIEKIESILSSPAYQPYRPHSTRVANAGPLGLFAFGYTTALLSCNYTKWTGSEGTTEFSYAFALMFGGLVQLLAGMWGIWRNNTFAGTAFSSYGAFWLGYGIYGILVSGKVLTGAEAEGEQAFLALWAIFTFCLFLQTFNINVALLLLFWFLTLAFALLSAGPNHPRVVKAGGYFGIAAAFMAFYTALAELTEEVYRRTILPVFILNVTTAQIPNQDARPDTL
ncbi:hypothetical protein WJX73_006609 [Symbiochloris irregularis]|uniref:Uncharacterized protein n=1 Tax=Symbiochloris irregularis TaxID=706552 RepID=A0AAW1NWX2_9CHLO